MFRKSAPQIGDDTLMSLFKSMTHQGMAFPRLEIDAVKRREVSAVSLYCEGLDPARKPILEGLMRPDAPVACLMGPRGTGKSITLTVAATTLNYNHANKQGKIAVQLSSTAITDAVADSILQLAANDYEAKLLVFAAIILEFYCNLKRIEIVHEKLAGMAATLFPWVLGTYPGGTPLLSATVGGVEQYLAELKSETRKTSETSLSDMYLHGASALLRLVRGSAAKDPSMALRQEYKSLCAGFLESLEKAGVCDLYLFLDDFSEATIEVQQGIQEICSELYNQSLGGKLRIFFRAAVYWGDRFELTSRANVVSGVTLSTAPVRKFSRTEEEMVLGALDRDLGAHIAAIMERRTKFFNISSISSCFDGAPTPAELQELFMFLGAASGGSVRLIGQMLSDLVQRRINSGARASIQVNYRTIVEHCKRYMDEYEGSIIRSGLDSSSKQLSVLGSYENIWDWVKSELRKEDAVGCIVNGRFLLGNAATVLYLKPFINSGLIYVWSEISFWGRPPSTSPTYILAINEAVRLANREMSPDQGLAPLGRIDVHKFEQKFARSQAVLKELSLPDKRIVPPV